jgi:diguanylate cyclase (GGDEF)-like protein
VANKPPSPPPGTPEGIEVVELSDVDLEFAVEEMFREGGHAVLDETRVESAKPDELAALELFKGIDAKELASIASRCQFIQAVPGYVVVGPGRLNNKIFFVVEGQLRLYPPTNDKRPIALVDIGHSTGLRSALRAQAADHAVISTEMSHVVAIELALLSELSQRSNHFAKNYAALLESYVRGDNCLYIGPSGGNRSNKPGYIDDLTLLHNQHWLETMFPRLVGRYRLGESPLSVVAFRIDKLREIIKEVGIGPGLKVLEVIGRWTLNQTRPTDILAIDKERTIYVFLPNGDLNAARQLANRLQAQLKTLAITPGGKAPQPISVTISIGITSLEKGMKETELTANACALIEKSIKLGGNWVSDKL